MVKINLSNQEESVENTQKKKEQEKLDTDSFVVITVEKTGLSKSVIKSSIRLDALASDVVKKARGLGELNAS